MTAPNQITGPNAGGPRQFPTRTPLAARVGQFALGCLDAQETNLWPKKKSRRRLPS